MLQSQMAEVRRREEEAAMLEQQQHALLQQQWDLEEAVRVCVCVRACVYVFTYTQASTAIWSGHQAY